MKTFKNGWELKNIELGKAEADRRQRTKDRTEANRVFFERLEPTPEPEWFAWLRKHYFREVT